MKYGSLSRSFGKLVASSLSTAPSNFDGTTSPAASPSSSSSSSSNPKKEPATQLFKSKSLKKKKLSDDLTPGFSNGLRKLSGNKNISPDLVNWINTLELKGKDSDQVDPAAAATTAPSSPTSPEASPSPQEYSFARRRGSIKPRLPGEVLDGQNLDGGKLYLRIVDMRHKLKGTRGIYLLFFTFQS